MRYLKELVLMWMVGLMMTMISHQTLMGDDDDNDPMMGLDQHIVAAKGKLLDEQTSPRDQNMNIWIGGSCQNLKSLFTLKETAIKKLDALIKTVGREAKMSGAEQEFRRYEFSIFEKELNESEKFIFQAIRNLKLFLQTDYKNIVNIKEGTKQRLEALRMATLEEEKEYNAILEAEKRQQMFQDQTNSHDDSHESFVGRAIDEILAEIGQAADDLEESLQGHVFADHDKKEGADIEAVVRLGYRKGNQSRGKQSMDELTMLVDPQENVYVLTKPKDSTISIEDRYFIGDIITILISSFWFGWLCSLVRLPPMFGYILSGIIFGPSGFNVLKSIVQMESLGEFGVFFIMFMLGLEFSPDKIHKVWRVAVFGSVSMASVMIAIAMVWGYVLEVAAQQSVFVAACLSLSSTPLVIKFLSAPSSSGGRDDSLVPVEAADYSSVLLGILVIQDIQLSFLIAILPVLSAEMGNLGDKGSALLSVFYAIYLVLKVLSALVAVLFLANACNRYVICKLVKLINATGSKELNVLGLISIAFVTLQVTECFGVSMELGCFLAGMMISNQNLKFLEESQQLLEPVRDVFACLFFASIGLHVFPSFVLYEISILMVLTMLVVSVKFVIGVSVLSVVLPPRLHNRRWIIAAGLSQVSEFSFVLGSRAKRLHILSREVYLVILSVTTLSLILSPALWHIALRLFRPKPLVTAK